jgi:hypothetical protein
MLIRLALCLFIIAAPLRADDEALRLAVFTVEMDRTGPGLLLRDLRRGDEQADAVARVIAHADPDVILLLRFDYDSGGLALAAFVDVLSAHGIDYPHAFSRHPNSGLMTDLDLDGDGRLRGPRDAQGYGLFAGHNGMAILSKLPLDTAAVRDFSGLIWRDLPGAVLPQHPDGAPFPSEEAQAGQRLSSIGHWDVPVILPGGGRLHLLAYHATPPVFDGPEDRNGLRNRDETRFWEVYLDGRLDASPPDAPVVVLGNANLDPAGGDGLGAAMVELLDHGRLQDPRPTSAGARLGGFRAMEISEADTVAWDAENEPGNLRVDYVLPDRRLEVLGAGVVWPAPGDFANLILGAEGRAASRHRLVWVDIALPSDDAPFLDPPRGSG